MLVQMNDLVATSFTFTSFGEIFVVGDNGANATTMTPRGGVVIGPGDLNPERMVIDDEWFKTGPPAMPAVNVGGTFPGAHVGILDYAFGEYRMQLRSQPVPASDRRLRPRDRGRSRREPGLDRDLQRREPRPATSRSRSTTRSPAMIVNNLAAPDIVGLEEIQDNNGAADARRRAPSPRPRRSTG